GPEHRAEHQNAVAYPKRRKLLTLPQRDLHDRHMVGLLQRLAQQYVRLGGYRLRLEVVRLVVEDRVHLLGRDELMYVDATTGGERQVSEVLVVEDHHLAAAEVVALGDVVVGDLFTVDAADALVLDPA